MSINVNQCQLVSIHANEWQLMLINAQLKENLLLERNEEHKQAKEDLLKELETHQQIIKDKLILKMERINFVEEESKSLPTLNKYQRQEIYQFLSTNFLFCIISKLCKGFSPDEFRELNNIIKMYVIMID